jgi:hypothetical protein
VGSGADYVNALEVNNDKLYVGGSFTTLGDGTSESNNIAVWDETNDTWSALVHSTINGLNYAVYDIAVSDASVYVGGDFTFLGDDTTPANYIAKWDESAGWSALIGGGVNGVDDNVNSILTDGTDIYIGGDFINLGDNSTAANHIVKWDGAAWSALSDGNINGTGEYDITALAITSDNLYIGGFFRFLGDNLTPANSIAIWNKSTPGWSTIGSGNNGVDDQVWSIAVNGNDVYVGGDFTTINGGLISAINIAKWNSATGWSALTGIDDDGSSYINAVAVSGTNIYAAGYFTSINNGTAAGSIAMWDGTSWSVLSDGTNNGVDGNIYAIAVDGNNVYVGGDFTTLSDQSTVANYVAKWDGSNWTVLTNGPTNGLSYIVNCLVIKDDEIYFGGEFENLACWNSSFNTWVDMTPSEGYYADGIYSLAAFENNIYAGCILRDPSTSNIVDAIAQWDNTNKEWLLLGSGGFYGPSGYVTSLASCGSDLYAASVAPGFESIPNDRISKWNTTTGWGTLVDGTSDGTNLHINTMAVNEAEGKMYVGGLFTIVGENTTAFNVARFADSDNPLPVELSSLSASQTNNTVVLNWTTATEVNNYGFEIERKSLAAGAASLGHSSSTEWEKIGFVEGAGNSNSTKQYSYKDENLPDGKFQYRLKQIDIDGKYKYYEAVSVEVEAPKEFKLMQNYPNPFNPTTTIKYSIPVGKANFAFPTHVQLKIYDILDNEVATLVDENKEPGINEVEWNADNVASGIYFYMMHTKAEDGAKDFRAIKKMLMIK